MPNDRTSQNTTKDKDLYLKAFTDVFLAKPQKILCFHEAIAILVAHFKHSFQLT